MASAQTGWQHLWVVPLLFGVMLSAGCRKDPSPPPVAASPDELTVEMPPPGNPPAIDVGTTAVNESTDNGVKPPSAPASNESPVNETGAARKVDSDPATTPAVNPLESTPAAETPPAPSSSARMPSDTPTTPVKPPESSAVAAETPPEKPATDAAAKEDDASRPAESKPSETAQGGLVAENIDEWKDWPKPEGVLLITGQQHGYIEPCGCTGLANQKGGLARRHSLVKQIVEKGWTLIPVDSGNQARRFGPQPAIKFQTAVDAMKEMGYRAVGFGPDDLRLGVENLLTVTTDDRSELKFISANIVLYDPSLLSSVRVVEAGSRKIGITSAIDFKYAQENLGADITISDPVEGLRKASERMTAENCNFRVLMWYGNEASATELLAVLPEWDVIILGDDEHEPTYQPMRLPGSKAHVITVGHKAMYVCMLGLFDDEKRSLRYARIPLTDHFEDSPEMMQRLATYQKHLEALGLERLGLRPIPHPTGREFVGTERCGECHTQAMAVWKETPHAHATESLIHPPERGDIPRQFDPECLSCHTTGWNPQNFYPYQGGYLSVATTPLMVGNGCENCHGPGAEHVAAESGDVAADEERLKALRELMRLPYEKARDKCLECHDIDNSPDFHHEGAFEEYWSQVVHKGMD